MRNNKLSFAALPPRRALQRSCRRNSLAFALMCLAWAARHTCGEGDGFTRHPEDVAASVRFRAPLVVAGCATELNVTTAGLVQGVTYKLVVSMVRNGDVVYADDTSIAWSRGTGSQGASHSSEHILPPLPAGPHTLRVTVSDAFASSPSGATLATATEALNPWEDRAARAACAAQTHHLTWKIQEFTQKFQAFQTCSTDGFENSHAGQTQQTPFDGKYDAAGLWRRLQSQQLGITSVQNVSEISRSHSDADGDRLRCIMTSPFVFHPIKHNKDFAWSIQSTVQSVRFDGPSGFPLRCDWVIGTRLSHWRQIAAETVFGDPRIKPKTIFVMREHLQHFHDYILPCLQRQERFVLIIGDQDTTTPRQIDKRYRFKPPVGIFYPSGHAEHNFEYSTWLAWMRDTRIGHIFVEHLDERTHPKKVSPIPIGLSPHEISHEIMHYSTCDVVEKLAFSPLRSRPLKVRFTNRLRQGPQFESRALCKEACDTSWKPFCVSARAPGGEAFLREIQQYPFLICAHGGGIDPNPMAWTALLVGICKYVYT